MHDSRLLEASEDIALPHTAPPQFPIHYASVWVEDDAEVEQRIKTAYIADPASISRRDDFGLTPIFLASLMNNETAVRVLLILGVRNDLYSLDNPDRLTPLKAVQCNMSGSAIEQRTPIIELLKHEMRQSEPNSACTCETCGEGWLSPRMRKGLLGMYVARLCSSWQSNLSTSL